MPDQGGVGPVTLLWWGLEGVIECLAGGVLILPAYGTNIAVAITGLPALHPHPVQHAVAEKPVITAEWRKLRVGPIAHKHAIHLWRQHANDLEIVCRGLFLDRRKVTLQKWMG